MTKQLFILYSLILLVLLQSCEKNELRSIKTTEVKEQAQLKVNLFSLYRTNPLFQIKINGVRVSNSLPAATPFPGGGLNTGGGSTADYLSVQPGESKISVAMPRLGTGTDSVMLSETNVSLNPSGKYSLYFSDTAANITSLLVMDTLKRPDSGYARFKFINLMPDLPTADLYIGTVKMASAIPYKGVSASFVVPTNNTSTTWGLRVAGGTANLITYASASSLSNQRVYTVVARGYNAVTVTTDVRSRKISLIYNQ